MEYLPEQLNETHPIFLALAEIQKPRSRFQLEKFVVGQHDTPEQQYKQTLLEIQHLYYTLKTVNLTLKKDQIEIDRLRMTGDEIDELDAQIKEIALEQSRLIAIGAQRELHDLIEIWESFEHKYTYEELETLQPEYWNKRLNRQSILESIGGSSAQASHLDSLRQIGALAITPQGIEATEPFHIEAEEPREIQ
jgi:hypothetical protein